MKIKNIALIIFSVLLIGIIYKVRSGRPQRNDNLLIVGTSPDYPPYESINVKTGEVEGFDIDVVVEIAQRMGKNLEIKGMPFTSLIFALLTGDVDMIAAGMSPTERRARLVAFTRQYLDGQPLVILTKSAEFTPKTVQDLQGKIVAVNTGYIADLYMSKQSGVELIKLDAPSDCFMALQSGAVDAFVSGQSTVQIFLQKTLNPQQYAMVQIPDTGEVCAFAVGKNDEKLLQKINQALDTMIADGTLETLKEKWKLS